MTNSEGKAVSVFDLSESSVNVTVLNINGTLVEINAFDNDGVNDLKADRNELDGNYIVLTKNAGAMVYGVEQSSLVKIETKQSGNTFSTTITMPGTAPTGMWTNGEDDTVSYYLVPAAEYKVEVESGLDFQVNYNNMGLVNGTAGTAYFYPENATIYMGDTDDTDGFRIVKDINGNKTVMTLNNSNVATYTVGSETMPEGVTAVSFAKEDYLDKATTTEIALTAGTYTAPTISGTGYSAKVTAMKDGSLLESGVSPIAEDDVVVFTIVVTPTSGTHYVDANTVLMNGSKQVSGTFDAGTGTITFTVSVTVDA